MKTIHFISAVIVAAMMGACGQKETTSSDLVHLNLQQAEKQEAPKLSTLLKGIRYVALETSENSVLKNVSYIVLTDKYIICEDKVQCYVFDKEDGRFLRTIGMRKDRGPEGYASPTNPLCVIGNEVLRLLFSENFGNDNAYFYHKAEQRMGYMNGKETKGFSNDLNGFLPFWPKDCGRGRAQNEVWAILQPDEYIEGVEATGVNPLGIDVQFDSNPILVIGTLK